MSRAPRRSVPTPPRRRTAASLTTASLVAVLAAGCSGDPSDPQGPVVLEGLGDRPGLDGVDETGGDDPPGEPSDGDEAEASEVTAGTLVVPLAGRLEVAVADGTVELLDVAPADGWRERRRDAGGRDRVSVRLEAEGGEATLDLRLRDDELRVELDLDVEGLAVGTLDLGELGTAEVVTDGERLTVTLRPGEGWVVVDEDADDDEVSYELAREGGDAEVELELDDGRLDVDIDATWRLGIG